MDLSEVNAVKEIIVHDNCADGLVSALLLHDALPTANLRFVQYGTEEFRNLEARPHMLFADFSPPAERAQEFIDAGALILDHHKTAQAVVNRFGSRGVFGDEVNDPGVCGAVLAFREVWEPICGQDLSSEIPFLERLTMLAGVRDTWQRQSPHWDEACTQHEILTFMPRERWLSMSLWDIAKNWDYDFRWIGEVLWEKHGKSVQKSIDVARRVRSPKGTRVVIFEGLKNTSDAAEILDKDTDLIAGFSYFEENVGDSRVTKMAVSTRSHTDFNCSALAKFYGGGGHTKAAGFTVNVFVNDPNPYNMIESLIFEFERTLNS